MTREQIRSYLELYRDLGVESIYKRGVATAVTLPTQTDESVLPVLETQGETLEQIRLDIGD